MAAYMHPDVLNELTISAESIGGYVVILIDVCTIGTEDHCE
jgi:hypothetical protein